MPHEAFRYEARRVAVRPELLHPPSPDLRRTIIARRAWTNFRLGSSRVLGGHIDLLRRRCDTHL